MSESPAPKKSFSKLFLSAQAAALAGTAVDFAATYLFTEFIGIIYWVSNAIGAALGAITNFLLGRYWVFEAKEKKMTGQAFRYILVSAGSLVLNTGGVYLLTETLAWHYMFSKVIVAVFIAVTYNFLLQRYFVFK